MKLATVVITASVVGGMALAAQSPAGSPTPAAAQELTDAFPAGTDRPDQFALSVDGQRSYFVNNAGEAWLYDRAKKTTARVAAGPIWDLNLSQAGTALAYTQAGDRRGEQYVWVLALNPATGLPSGAERRLSSHPGDVPSLSPDGKLVAFARDDATGVGQSVVVVPASGGTERVVAAGMPSSLANIRWTPDGKTLYLGVNSPVACVPEWSCLPLAQELRQPPGTFRRVAASGGQVTTVATARGVSPGLSPDGTTLMYLDTGTVRQWVVANADGTRRNTVTLPTTQTPIAWLQASTVLIAESGSTRDKTPPSLLTMDLSAARVR